MIDFHSHLDLYPNPQQVIEGIIQRKMYVLSVTTTPSAWRGTYSLSKHFPRIKTAIGLHPQIAHQRNHELELFDTYLAETDYVGEVGLDGSPELKDYFEVQTKVFSHILASCCHAGGKILSIHSRRAAAEVLEALVKYPSSGVPVLHWYTGSKTELRTALKMGCWFSVGPAMLRSKRAMDLISEIPKNRIITESDGPFATNGENVLLPWDVEMAIKKLSQIWKCDFHEANEILYSNFKSLLALK